AKAGANRARGNGGATAVLDHEVRPGLGCRCHEIGAFRGGGRVAQLIDADKRPGASRGNTSRKQRGGKERYDRCGDGKRARSKRDQASRYTGGVAESHAVPPHRGAGSSHRGLGWELQSTKPPHLVMDPSSQSAPSAARSRGKHGIHLGSSFLV